MAGLRLDFIAKKNTHTLGCSTYNEESYWLLWTDNIYPSCALCHVQYQCDSMGENYQLVGSLSLVCGHLYC